MTSTVPAESGSYSEHANALINEHFPNKIAEVVAAIVACRRDGSAVLGPDGSGHLIKNLTNHILHALQPLDALGIVTHVDCWQCYDWLPEMQRTFVSPDGSVTLIAVNYDIAKNHGRLLPVLEESLSSIPAVITSDMEVFLTGLDAINKASINGTINNLQHMDSIAFPSALFALGAVLRSCRLMILPVLAVVFAAVLSFGVLMYPTTVLLPIFILSSSLMMSLTIAMTIDYSLFVLGRFQSDLKISRGALGSEKVEAAVARTLATAGHTVLVSGITLMLSFVGLLISLDPFMVSIGIGSALAILGSMVSSLVLTPTLILAHPSFFGTVPSHTSQVIRSDDDESLLHRAFELQPVGDGSQSTLLTHVAGQDASASEQDSLLQLEANILARTRWFKFSKWLLSHKSFVILCVLPAFIWPLVRLPHMQLAFSPLLLVPRWNSAFQGFRVLHKSFGASLLWPTKLLMVPPNGETVLSADFFNRAAFIIENLSSSLPPSPRFQAQSIAYFNNSRVPFSAVQLALVESSLVSNCNLLSTSSEDRLCFEAYMFCNVSNPDACQLLRLARQRLVNADATAMVVSFLIDADPWSDSGAHWLLALRAALPQSGPDTYVIVSNPSSVLDTISGIYRSSRAIILVTSVVIFGVVSLSFKSIVIPIRLLPSIALTISWVYGLAVLVYQDGVLSWAGVGALAPVPSAPGIAWPLPALCFTILAGLCLDYDIFVLNRVAEFRLAGFCDRDAVILGVSATGHTITVAGGIMLIAFSGLLMSSQLLLNQLSFFLISCVLIDTFVVRSIIVPICMDLLSGGSNWWPRKMPLPHRTVQTVLE